MTDYMSYTRGNVRVEWEDIGEGVCGDYDPKDPTDKPLLRFTVLQKIKGKWEQVDDASYCTYVMIDTPKKILKRLLRIIYGNVAEEVRKGCRIKKLCEQLSWIDETWIKKERHEKSHRKH
jgi:hypothetical protein